jgi:hypothetical protein
MHNENSTAGKEQVVPQDNLERVLKLAHSGSSPEDISFYLNIDIETIQQIIVNDPMHRAREIKSIKERSAEYRCAQSNRLMISPVMDHDENFYEQSILEADPSFSRDRFIPSKKLKAKIADFSRESLKALEGYLRQKDPQEDILQLTAECLSVVIPDAGLESALRVLGIVEGETLRRLTGKLRGLVPEEMLFRLMTQLANQLPSHALCLAALIILEPCSERALEEAFRCFAELLSQVALDAGAIDLAEEVSKRLSRSQLSQMNAALGAHPSEGGDRLDGLRLKEAYALLREGEVEAAICLVNTLRITPHLEKEVLRFFDEAGLSSGKVPILKQRLSAKLEEISRDSPSLAEALSILHQLHKAELQSHKPQDARIQRLEEQTQRREADDQETLASLRAKVEVLTEELAKTGQTATQTQIAQDARIQRLEEQALRKEADDKETHSSLRAKAEALTEELVKTEEEISQVKRAQETQFQRLDEKLSEAGEATQECLISLRAELLALHQLATKSEEEAKRVQSFIEQSQKAEAATQEVFSRLRVSVEALTRNQLEAGEEISQVKRAQDAWIQRSEADSEECLISLRAELRALHEQAAKSEEEDKRVRSFVEQFQRAHTAAQEALSSLRGEVGVLSKDLAQVANQCKKAQLANEATYRSIEGKSEKTEAAAQKTLKSLSDKVEGLTREHLKAGEEIKQVKSTQDTQIHRLNEKFNEAETATHQALNILRGDCRTLREDLDQAWSQCKQAQEAMLQRIEEQLKKTEANALKLDRAVTPLQDHLYHLHEVTLPTFTYSLKCTTDQLHRTSLVTGEQSSHRVPSYTFRNGCCWSEVPGGSLLITGGWNPGPTIVREVVRIDVRTFEVSPKRDMNTPRGAHAAVYHNHHLYVLGGRSSKFLSDCERYVFAENRWEALPPLPTACISTSGIVVESSLYALGGTGGSALDLVQKLSLVNLTWELMQIRLPFTGSSIPCFKVRDTEVYLIVNKTLCSFTSFEVRPLETLTESINSWAGASYYRRGTLYCSDCEGAVLSHEIGSLSN